MEDAIYIKNQQRMTTLFAIDDNAKDVVVSTSEKGSSKIGFVERIAQTDNSILYSAVELLTTFSRAPYFDASIFKAVDKVCLMIYLRHKENSPTK